MKCAMKIQLYEHGKNDLELFGLVGAMAVSLDVHKSLGVAVTSMPGDMWFVATNDLCETIGFAQIRVLKNKNMHIRYLYAESSNEEKVNLIRRVIEWANDLEIKTLYTKSWTDSTVI